MPFPEQTPRAYTKANVEALKKDQIGVYGLFKGVWMYVGKGDIRQCLLDHLNGDNSCITKQAPTSWVAPKLGQYQEIASVEVSNYPNLWYHWAQHLLGLLF